MGPGAFRLARQLVPGPLKRWRRRLLDRRHDDVTRRFAERHGFSVRTGPFRGMKYGSRAVGSALGPKLLGTYEQELTPVIRDILGRAAWVIDVGAAEGYYACGLLTLRPDLRATAFEASESGREALAETAGLNGVADRLEILGECDRRQLANLSPAPESTYLIMDVEGAEAELLDPTEVPWLRRTPLVVELHRFVDAGIPALLEARFGSSHDVTRIVSEPRTARDLPADTGLSPADLLCLADERRPGPMDWFWMRPRQADTPVTGGS